MIPEEILNPIYPMAGYCILQITLLDKNNQPMRDMNINCVDGSRSWEYTTNEKGIVKFTTNSGQVDIVANNWSNSIKAYFADMSPNTQSKIPAPIGDVIRKSITMRQATSRSITKNGPYAFYYSNYASINLSGGGGGGGAGNRSYQNQGGRGGNGYVTTVNDIPIDKNTVYWIYIGAGGNGGTVVSDAGYAGNTGGTTTAFGYQALGGNGGTATTRYGSSNGSGGNGATGGSGGAWGGGAGSSGSNGWCSISMR